jgi:flagellar motility protein MotE (MotC chaperone)
MAGRSARHGVLVVLSTLLVGSGLLRAGGEAGHVLAATEEPALASEGPQQDCMPREEMAAILVAFEEREARLADRDLRIADRMQALTVAEEEVMARIEELKQAEADLAATIAQVESAAETDLDRLVAVYESMKPADASALFQTMAPEFAAGFIARMRPEAAADILTGLEPASAYSISVILAGRNAGAPDE